MIINFIDANNYLLSEFLPRLTYTSWSSRVPCANYTGSTLTAHTSIVPIEIEPNIAGIGGNCAKHTSGYGNTVVYDSIVHFIQNRASNNCNNKVVRVQSGIMLLGMTISIIIICATLIAEILLVYIDTLYRIAGYFRGVYISRTANSILVREK